MLELTALRGDEQRVSFVLANIRREDGGVVSLAIVFSETPDRSTPKHRCRKHVHRSQGHLQEGTLTADRDASAPRGIASSHWVPGSGRSGLQSQIRSQCNLTLIAGAAGSYSLLGKPNLLMTSRKNLKSERRDRRETGSWLGPSEEPVTLRSVI